MRYPKDDPTASKDPTTKSEELFQILTEAYSRAHSTMLKVLPMPTIICLCGSQFLNDIDSNINTLIIFLSLDLLAFYNS